MSKIDQNERQNTSDYHIEGILEVPDPANIFPLPPIPSRSKQGLHAGQRIAIYFAGSRAIQHGVQPLGVTAFICGVTGRRYVDERILDKRSVGTHQSSPIPTTLKLLQKNSSAAVTSFSCQLPMPCSWE